jgi:hypothetical protein
MTRIERNHRVVQMEEVRPGTKRETTAPSAGLAIAGLRESVDGLELRLDDVDERVAALELDASAESTTEWEALARGSVPRGAESVSDATADGLRPAEPEALTTAIESPTQSVVADAKRPQANETTSENPHATSLSHGCYFACERDKQLQSKAQIRDVVRDPAVITPRFFSEVYLDSINAHRVAQLVGQSSGDALSVSERTLVKRLHEGGWLASTEPGRGRNKVRRYLSGRQRGVLHMRATSFSEETAKTAIPARGDDERQATDSRQLPGWPETMAADASSADANGHQRGHTEGVLEIGRGLDGPVGRSNSEILCLDSATTNAQDA